jgi:hypothetical protein
VADRARQQDPHRLQDPQRSATASRFQKPQPPPAPPSHADCVWGAGTLTLHLWKKAATGVPWPVLVVGPASPDAPDALDALSLFSLGEALESGRPEFGIMPDSATALRHYAKVSGAPPPPPPARAARRRRGAACLPRRRSARPRAVVARAPERRCGAVRGGAGRGGAGRRRRTWGACRP